MTIRLIKKSTEARVKSPEVDKLEEKDLQRQARQLAKAWNIKPGRRFRAR